MWSTTAAATDPPTPPAAPRPGLRCSQAGGNLGFGPAVNLAARRSDTGWLAIANADVAPEPGALDALVRCGERDLGIGAVAPRLILPDGRTQHSVGALPTVSLAVAFALGLARVIPGLGDRLCLESYWNPERAREVPWAVGAFLLLRRDAFDAVGGFDERQWMYAEDVDVCWRLHDGGWTTRYEPAARVGHANGAATAAAFGPERTARFTRATYAVIARRRGVAAAWATAAINVAGTAARLAWLTPAALVRPSRREPWRDCRRWLAAHRQGLRSAADVTGRD